MKLILIEHYDSFSDNLIDWLTSSPNVNSVEVVQFDDEEAMRQVQQNLTNPLVFSPGPKAPKDVPQSVNLFRVAFQKVPILGICLGHQIIAHCLNCTIAPLKHPIHGSTKSLRVSKNSGLFKGLVTSPQVAVYNSLTVQNFPTFLQDEGWLISAQSEDGEILAIENIQEGLPATIGMQFHPESFMTENESLFLENTLRALQLSC